MLCEMLVKMLCANAPRVLDSRSFSHSSFIEGKYVAGGKRDWQSKDGLVQLVVCSVLSYKLFLSCSTCHRPENVWAPP
jgi:hypothetical protein